jgi:predicted outer membrane lipoprotein
MSEASRRSSALPAARSRDLAAPVASRRHARRGARSGGAWRWVWALLLCAGTLAHGPTSLAQDAPGKGAPQAPAEAAEPEPTEAKGDAIPAKLKPAISVSVRPKEGIAVGDLITLQLEASVDPSVQISVPEQSFAPLELHARRSRVEKRDGKQHYVFELDLLALEPGSITLPALTLRAVDEDGALAEVKTEPIAIQVASLIANEPNAEPKDATGPVPVIQDDYTLAWVFGGLLAAALVVLLTLWTKRWLDRRPKPAPAPPAALPPWEVALRKLAELDARKTELLAQERGEEFVDGVSDALREYLGKRYGFEGLESTTDEVLRTLERIRPYKLSLSGVSLLLEQCDLVKFARAKPDLAQCDDLWNGAVGLIRATTPAPEPAAPAEPKS